MANTRSVTIKVETKLVAGKRVFYYKSNNDDYCDDQGNVYVPFNTNLTAKWVRKKNEQWSFKEPFFNTVKNVNCTPKERKKSKTKWVIRNAYSTDKTETKYYLYTDDGPSPDPMLTLEGSGGGLKK